MNRILLPVRTFVRSRLFRVGVIGIIGLIIQTTIFEVLGIYLGIVSASTAAIIGGEVAILTNFTLNHRFSFGDRRTGNLLARLLRFHTVVAGSLLLQWLFIFTTEQFTNDVVFIHLAYFAGVGLGFLTNYAGYHFFVWKKHNPAEPPKL